ncbi:universal stress protein [Haliangium sp.]|uniref:universal stress protein n=1 Tax=Haliangium sp. TaxID=2663208 RepID=UPI003D14CB70
MSTTILFATDFSAGAEHAARITRAVARHVGAEVVCMHAVVMTEARPDEYEIATGEVEAFRRSFQEDLAGRRSRLHELVESFSAQGVSAHARLVDGPTVDVICQVAGEVEASLVVVGSHGRSGLRRMLLGSVAERVARLSPCSVLVARPPATGSEGFHRVLIPVDVNALAEVALDQGAALAAPDAHIDLLHCWLLDEFPDGMLAPLAPGASHRAAAVVVSEHLRVRGQELAQRVGGDGREVGFHLCEGRATAGIHSFMDENQPYDLVVVGTHGRTGMRRLLLGSVAESTVRYAPCSVLVARARVQG